MHSNSLNAAGCCRYTGTIDSIQFASTTMLGNKFKVAQHQNREA